MKSLHKHFSTTAIGLLAVMGSVAHAADNMPADTINHKAMEMKPSASANLPLVEGEVRMVDKEGGKITIKHGAIPNLNMMGMTMVFRAQNPAMQDQIKPGDRIRFAADKGDGLLTVVKIEIAK
jgi:Cu(I)/Ag(I) efflux system protein CusF